MEDKLDIEKSKMTEFAMMLKSNNLSDIRKSCFCLPLRETLLAWGYLKLGLVFVFGLVLMNVVTLTWMMDMKNDSIIELSMTLIYLGLELVFTNALIIGMHTHNLKVLRVYMYFLTINILLMFGLFIGLLVIPMVDLVEHQQLHMFNIMLRIICAASIYLALNIYAIILVRNEINRLSGDISYERLNEETVITGVTPPNSDNYFLVTKLNPNSKSGPPRFLVKKFGKVSLNPT